MKLAKVGAGITTMPEAAFAACFSMETIILPAGLAAVDAQVFFGCNALKTVHFGGSTKQRRQITVNEYENDALLYA